MNRDEILQSLTEMLGAKYGWTGSPGDMEQAEEQAEWIVEWMEENGLL